MELNWSSILVVRVNNERFLQWITPALRDYRVRRDLSKYLHQVPTRNQLLDWADQQRSYNGHVLVVWAREDRLMPLAHAEQLIKHFKNAEIEWVDDSYTLIPIDQPKILVCHLRRFLSAHAWS